VGSGIAFAFWSHAPASAAWTVGTAALTVLAISWLDPLAALTTGLAGITILHFVLVRPAVLRCSCVTNSALVLSGLVSRIGDGKAGDALVLAASLIAAVALPKLLAAAYTRGSGKSTSILTCAGMVIPSTAEAIFALGCCVVIAVFSLDPLAGVIASVSSLLPIAWLSDRREVRAHGTVLAASR
jgi:hypothetical protein